MSSEANQSDIVLYSTSACHLCEQAETLLLELAYPFRKIDIAFDDQLMERYGVLIPVLSKMGKTAAKSELYWPFDKNKIKDFIRLHED